MKLQLLAFAIVPLVASLSNASAQERYFDLNGATTGFGLENNGSYVWNTSAEVWNTSSSGGSGEFSAWTDGMHAVFNRADLSNTAWMTVRLAQDVVLGGLTLSNGDKGVTLRADTATTISFNPGAIVHSGTGNRPRGIVFGDHIYFGSDLILRDGGEAYTMPFQINGLGDKIESRIIINSSGNNGGLFLTADTRVGNKTTIVLNGSNLLIETGGIKSIGNLSGLGGYLTPTAAATLEIHQTEDQEWAGQIGKGASNDYLVLTKKGSGRLSLTGTSMGGNELIHSSSTIYTVSEGALYIAAKIQSRGAHPINIANGATFGGTTSTEKNIVLQGAESVLDVGMFEQAGTMTLSGNMTAANGGILRFKINGKDEEDDLANSLLVNTAGNISFGGTEGNKIVEFVDLEAGLLQAGVTYTLWDASSTSLTRAAGWDENWTWAINSKGWEVASFEFVENQLQVSFAAIPEPGSVALLTVGLSYCLYRRRSTTKR